MSNRLNVNLRIRPLFLYGLVISLSLIGPPAHAQEGKLEQSGPEMKQHLEKILEKFEQGTQYGKKVGQDVESSGKSEQYPTYPGTAEGAEEHPWLKRGNPQSEQDYKKDSTDAVDEKNLKELWSCLEPRLIGEWKPAPRCIQMDLCIPCYIDCVLLPSLINPFLEHDFEVIEFWWPEHQIDVQNYGINRLKPEEQSEKGDKYVRRKLVQDKRKSEDEIKDRLEEKDAIKKALLKTNRKFKNTPGQGHAGAFAPDLQEKDYVHGYRTRVSYKVAEDRPEGGAAKLGWEREKRCIANALAPKKEEKDILHLWSEYGLVDAIWTMPEMTRELGQREEKYYKAGAPEPGKIQEVGKKDPPWWKNKGAAAYRLARWPDMYGDLKDVGIEPNEDNDGREIFYRGGGQLAPFVGNLDGFFPPLSAAAILARRGFYMMGVKEGKLPQYHPDGEKGRMNEYTILDSDRGREVDKMQRAYPDGPSECFRSQRIPNITEQTSDSWVQKNFPHDLVKDWKDQKGSINYTAWNKRVACTCKYFSATRTGCWQMDAIPDGLGPGRGTGDRPYGRFETPVCKYMEGLFPSAFFGGKRICVPGGGNYKGIDDNV